MSEQENNLEKRYRGILRFLPKAYRADRGEEMLTVLLDGARPGQTRPRIGDVFSLGSLAVRLRFGAPGASPRAQLTGDVARRAIVISLMVACSVSVSSVAFIAGHVAGGPVAGFSAFWLLRPALVLALVFGLRRLGRVLCVLLFLLSGLGLGEEIFWGPAGEHLSLVIYVDQILTVVIALAVFPAFHREAPRMENRRWWLLAWAVPLGVLAVLGNVFTPGSGVAVDSWPVIYALAGVAAIGFAVKQAKVSPVWPIALAFGGWQLLASAVDGAYFPYWASRTLLAGVAFAAEAVLIGIVLASVVYHRRHPATA